MAHTAQITQDDQNRRLDRILRKAFPGLPLSAIHRMIRKGQVHIDGKPMPPSFKPQAGSILEIHDLDTEKARAVTPSGAQTMVGEASELFPMAPPFDILFENEALLCINKRAGIPVHGDNSLDKAVRDYLAPVLPASLSFKPGPLHRLDQGTSGVIVFSKNLAGAQIFSEALREHRLIKWYIAVLQGTMVSSSNWNDAIGRDRRRGKSRVVYDGVTGKEAHTTVYPALHNRDTKNPATLAIIKLGTGRTHQIRVQAASHGHPLLGDTKYGAKRQAEPWLLHAYELAGLDTLNLSTPDKIRASLSENQLSWMEKLFYKTEQLIYLTSLRETPPLSHLLDGII